MNTRVKVCRVINKEVGRDSGHESTEHTDLLMRRKALTTHHLLLNIDSSQSDQFQPKVFNHLF